MMRAYPRIAIAGFQHETNCFGTTKAGLREFEMADSWPAMLHGEEVITETRGMNLPIAGFAKAAKEAGMELVPILWCAAEPSAHVTDHAFDAICGKILDGLGAAWPVDGIFLDLHGAMVTESHADGEGELLRRLRAWAGPELPISVSLDLHANISKDLVDLADYIAIYRTYPHLDMAETGERCVPVLQHLLAGDRLHKVFRQMDYLIPLHAQYTSATPGRDLYAVLPRLEEAGVLADIALGFTAADLPDTRPSCVAYARTAVAAAQAADHIASLFARLEAQSAHPMLSPEQAAKIACQPRTAMPVVLADVQDNPGAGGTSDTTGLLAALADAGAQNVLMGLFHDPEAAAAARKAGQGGLFRTALGGRSGVAGDKPFEANFEVLALGDGICRYSGEMYGGGVAALGPTAALRLTDAEADISLVVTSIRNQCLDLAHFTHIGLNPETFDTICVKSTAHFRAAFEPIASAVYPVAAPGVFPCDLGRFPYKNLHPAVRAVPAKG
ncbi:M81 family metallopeptidase [Leisingera daeponensis]|uniref:M81 family metallopeptidase n=1 Tax=Leisingera daeponensis TaxID=405746 RepID=UPI001C942141|nr:M81 family metallopeptidase [Leisingera daeponensis]MBY6059462.1 M81 family metallopeptidase [Leisingera daeponensis]